ncbi:MAG TPA: rhodanese-like domain-containing protein [Flavobacteriales bacterium]|nr:rhodanese-like domain-containing protein [Flavobacteriales bacterium]
MRKKLLVLSIIALTAFANCNNAQTTETSLEPKQFSEKIKSNSEITVVDVRTTEEYLEGHLPNALNIDWNGNAFMEQVSKLDKEKPVMVYCRSGRRSGEAAAKMRKEGFKEVYELKGGIIAWTEQDLPQEK